MTNTKQSKPSVILKSVITCPKCGHKENEIMPTDACQFFYDCKGCGELLRPKQGDCCVFCSYGTVPCPPIQSQDAGCDTEGCCSGKTKIPVCLSNISDC